MGPKSMLKQQAFEWSDLDKEADDFNKRRLKGEEVPVEEHVLGCSAYALGLPRMP